MMACKHMRQEKVEKHIQGATRSLVAVIGRMVLKRQLWDQTVYRFKQEVGTLKAKGTVGPRTQNLEGETWLSSL